MKSHQTKKKHPSGRGLLALFSALALLLGACAAPGAGRDALGERPTLAPLRVDEPHIANLVLFYYTEDGNRRIAYRRVPLQEGQTRALMTVRTLFSNDWSDEYSQMPDDWQPVFDVRGQGMDVDFVEVSGNTANISIRSIDGASKPPNDQRIRARVPLANSLIETLGVEYVNIYFNGEAMVDYYNQPLGAMSRYDGSPQEYYEEVETSRDQPLSYTANVTLYFPDATGKFLVMETRPMELSDQRGFEVVNALLAGPNNRELRNIIDETPDDFDGLVSINTENHIAPYSTEGEESVEPNEEEEADVIISDEEAFINGESMMYYPSAQTLQTVTKRVTIHAAERFDGMGKAAIVCSLQGLFSDVSGVTAVFGEQVISDLPGETREDFHDHLGQLIYPYASTQEGSLLHQETVAVPQDRANDPKTVLEALFAVEPEKFDAVFSSSWRETALRSATWSGTSAIVDLSSEVVQRWNEVTEAELRLQLSAMVNTLTQIHGIREVQILVDGERKEDVGALTLSQPLVANPAMNAE